MLFNFGKCKCLHIGSGNTGVNYEMGGTILSKTVKMNKLYKENKRPFFRNGRLYAENRPVPFGLIDNFLSSEEGRAATK